MSWFQHLLSSELIYRMGCALFGSLWQGVLVALLLAGALAVIPRTKSSLRYWCGCIALFALPVLFCATAVLVGERANVMLPVVPETTSVAMDGTTTEKIDSSTSGGGTGRIDEPVVSAAADIEPAEVAAPATPWYSRLSDTVEPWTAYVVLCWFVGVFAMSVWNLGGWIAVRRLRCIGISTAPERFVDMLGKLAGRLGVKHSVRLLQSAVVQSPMTIGWLKPVILVPASILCELSPRQIETILAHELVHIRRFDYLVNLLQTVIETLLFHHPAVWWISHKIRTERECCCDDAVVKLTSDELNYAKALTAVADLRRDVPQLAVAATGGSLLSRIQRILGLSNKKTLSGSTWLASLLALVICIAAAVSIVNAASAPPRDATSQKLIIGTWKSTTFSGHWADRYTSLTMTFEQNGSGEATSILTDDARQKENTFTWKFDGRKLLIGTDKLDDDPEAYRWNIRRNKLRLRDGKGLMEFERTEKIEPDDIESPIGTWDMIEGTGSYASKFKSVTVVFDADGRWTLESVDSKGQDRVEGRYTFKGGRVWFRENDDMVIEFDAERMTISENDTTFTLKRRDDAETAKTQSIVGTWKSRQLTGKMAKDIRSITVIFRADGTAAIKRFAARGDAKVVRDAAYKIIGDQIELIEDEPGEKPETIMWEMRGKSLLLGERDEMIEFERTENIEPDDIESPIGTWDMIEGTDSYASKFKSVTVVFDADGRWTLESVDSKGKKHDNEGKYTFKGGRVWFRENDDVVIEFDAEHMTMSQDNTTWTFKRRDDAESLIGKWKCVDVPDEEAARVDYLILEFNSDQTGRSSEIGFDGEELTSESFAYKIDGDRILGRGPDPDDKWEALQWRIEADVLYLTDEDRAYKYMRLDTRAQARLKLAASPDVDITPYVGSWLIPDRGVMTIDRFGVVTMHPFEGDPEQAMMVRSDNGEYILNQDNNKFSMAVTGDALSFTQIDDTAHPDNPHQYSLKRIRVDERFVGSWKSKDFTGSIDKQITALFLILNDDLTFTLLGEGEDAGEPIKGFYQTDGDILTLRARSSDKEAMDFIKSARYDSPTIRLAIGGGAAVMSKVIPNPFDGSDHPMFRATLTSTESKSGQIWLDLDTGTAVSSAQRNFMSAQSRASYELTLEEGEVKLASAAARMLPVHNTGMNFARAGANAVKYIPSLEKSMLKASNYKGGIFLAVMTDRGKLAVVEMMTPTATDETPLAWSLARITQSDGNEPQVNVLTQTDPVEKETVEIKSRRVTIPDADTKNVPTILDLAGGEMLQIPDESEGVDLIGHFTKLGKGDLLFDRLFAVLRGGKAQIWKDAQWTPLTPEDRQADATAYKLPESLPCRLLVTTGDGKQFDVTVLAKTEDGGIEIEYKPVGSNRVPVVVLPQYDHFVGTYSIYSIAPGGVAEAFEIVKQGQDYLFGEIGRTKKPMIITGQGLAAEDAAEQFIFKFDPKTKRYSMEIRIKKDNTLAGTVDLIKITGPNAQATSMRDRALATALKVQLHTIDTAIQMYRLDNGKWPVLENGWTDLTGQSPKGLYIKIEPVNPFTNGSKIAADTSADWKWDPATGKVKAVVPFTIALAKELGLDVEAQVVAAGAERNSSVPLTTGVDEKSGLEKGPEQPQQPLPAISIAPSIETVGQLKKLRIIAQAVNAYGAEKIVKAGVWEIRTADNSKRVAQIPFDWPWPKSPETTPLGPDGKPPWLGWGSRSGVFNLNASQLRRTGRLEDGVYLLAWIINGTRQSNVCNFRINRRHKPANEPLLKLSALPPAPQTTRNGRLVPPKRLLSLRYTRRTDKDPVINNDQVAFATLNVDGRDRRLKMFKWVGPVGPPKVGGHVTYLLDMGNYEPAIEFDKPHLVIAKIDNQQSNDIDLTPVAAGSPAWDVAAAKLGPPQAARIAIRGRVIGSNGKGAANYTVYVEHEEWKNNTGDLPVEMTDKDGYFAFYNLPAGLYDVFANPVGKGQPMLRITGIRLTEKKPVDVGLDFEHKFTFSGRVTDTADQPVSGRDVMATWKSPDGKAEFDDFATTDADGRYTLGSPFPVAAYVGLSGTGPQPKPHRNVRQGRRDINFQTARANE